MNSDENVHHKKLPEILLVTEDIILIKLLAKRYSKLFCLMVLTNSTVSSYLLKHKKSEVVCVDKKSVSSFSYKFCLIDLTIAKDNSLNFTQVIDQLASFSHTIILLLPIRLFDELYSYVVFVKEKHKHNSIVVLSGDLFGVDVPRSYSPVSELVIDGLVRKKILLSGNDLSQVFPVSVESLFNLFDSVFFGNSSWREIYFGFYEHPQTVLSCIHILRRYEQELSLDLKDEKTFHKELMRISRDKLHVYIFEKLATHVYYVFPQDEFEKNISHLSHHESLKPTDYKAVKVKKGTYFFDFTFTFVSSFIMFCVINLLFLLLSVYHYTKSLEFLSTDNKVSLSHLSSSFQYYTLTKPSLDLLVPLTSGAIQNPQLPSHIKDYGTLLSLANDLEKLATDIENSTIKKDASYYHTTYFQLEKIKNNKTYVSDIAEALKKINYVNSK